eukprot:CAMPEP_0113876456 /NCGR_PEP_ID=MMETSP0780_2-20120614/5502_1 /TAXON_ID=652834 /ORGANISM="Palpitomonas bilix" /LENGTH=48 /DNA_ID=CAMNT_0000862547 /DNA_START=92 /DNA_END=238 /DNA_ORIENTATION=- /assembly_acc=CAM_ASM_000599
MDSAKIDAAWDTRDHPMCLERDATSADEEKFNMGASLGDGIDSLNLEW